MIKNSVFAIALIICLQAVSQSSSPNIVFFLVDDMGWQDTSVPFHTETTALNQQYHSPNMEKLASEGMKFTQAYATAVCSPTRISLMTGMNAARHKVTTWTLRKDKSPSSSHKTLAEPAWNVNGLSADPSETSVVYTETLPQLLQEAGYKTIHAGKAHFGAIGTSGEDPKNLGFDVNIAGHAAGGPGSYLGKYNYSADWREPGNHIWDVPGLDKYHGTETYLTEAITIEAIKEMKLAVSEGKPFYLYLAHYAIHAPWEIDDRFYQKYLDAGLSKFDATYAAMIEGMDKSLGDVMTELEALGVDDNTIIVFMSDNGQPSQAPRNRPLRGHKLMPYEGGIRVPMIVKWPGVTASNSVNNEYLIIEDVFPTFLEMAGSKAPTNDQLDGVSFLPLLKGDSRTSRPIFWHYPNLYDQPPYSAVRHENWKLIYHHADQRFELFDLDSDISEANNMLSENPEKAAALVNILNDHLVETEAQMPKIKATGESVDLPLAAYEK